MICGPTVGNHRCTVINIFLLLSYFHQLRRCIYGIFFVVHLELDNGSIFMSNYSERYYFKFLFILGLSLKKHSIRMFVSLFKEFQLY